MTVSGKITLVNGNGFDFKHFPNHFPDEIRKSVADNEPLCFESGLGVSYLVNPHYILTVESKEDKQISD